MATTLEKIGAWRTLAGGARVGAVLHCVSVETLPQRDAGTTAPPSNWRAPMARILAFAAAAAVFFAAPAQAQSDHHPQRPSIDLGAPAINGQMSDAELSAALGSWLADLAARGVFSGVVLLARDGREVFTAAHGQADSANGIANTADTSFNIGSIGKALTQSAIMQLLDAGQLSMSTRIGDVIPDYPNEVTRAATVQQLLTHSAGVADFFGQAFAEAPKEQFASNADYSRFVSQLPSTFAPGEGEQYCNGCYVVLGEIIARVSGMTYEDYIAQNVYARAGMTRAGFYRADQPRDFVARRYGHPGGPGTEAVDVAFMHGVAGSAAGGSYASARDLLALDNAMREHRLFGASGPRETGAMGIAGGAPGVNAVVEGGGSWTLVVAANQSPPIAQALAQAVFPLLAGDGASQHGADGRNAASAARTDRR